MRIKNVKTYFYQKRREVHCVLTFRLALHDEEYGTIMDDTLREMFPTDINGDLKPIKIGSKAMCSQRDHFDFNKGKKIALRRANKFMFGLVNDIQKTYIDSVLKDLALTQQDIAKYDKAYDCEKEAIKKLLSD